MKTDKELYEDTVAKFEVVETMIDDEFSRRDETAPLIKQIKCLYKRIKYLRSVVDILQDSKQIEKLVGDSYNKGLKKGHKLASDIFSKANVELKEKVVKLFVGDECN